MRKAETGLFILRRSKPKPSVSLTHGQTADLHQSEPTTYVCPWSSSSQFCWEIGMGYLVCMRTEKPLTPATGVCLLSTYFPYGKVLVKRYICTVIPAVSAQSSSGSMEWYQLGHTGDVAWWWWRCRQGCLTGLCSLHWALPQWLCGCWYLS